jgi:hypothetical protein
MDIWQRGTSFALASGSTTTYAADRWQPTRGATGSTFSRQTVSDSTNLPTIQYALRCQRDSGNTSTIDYAIRQSVETANAVPYAGRTVTLSWYARAGANYSATSSLLNYQLQTGTGTDQNNVGGYTGSVNALNSTITLTTTWQRFAATVTLASTATEFAVIYYSNPTGTAGANDWFEVTGVQMDLGTYTASTAPAFRRSQGTIQGELAACQRYFEILDTVTQNDWVGDYYSIFNIYAPIFWKVTKRNTPTLTLPSVGSFIIWNAGASLTPSSVGTDTLTTNGGSIYGVTSARTAGSAGRFRLGSNTISVSAEL